MKETLNLVQVIVIFEKQTTIKKECVSKLLDFFASEKKYECKLCMLDTFRSVCETNGVPSQYVDFGIYGDSMLFVSEQYVPTHKGTYYKDENRIRLYMCLFDEIWNSDFLAVPNISQCKSVVSVSDLLRLDNTVCNV